MNDQPATGATTPARQSLPLLGLGCAKMGSFNNPSPLGESIALLREALDLGVTLLDTANIYGQGDSERAIGRAIAGQRDRAFVVTKAGNSFSAKMRLLRPFKPLLRPLLAKRQMGGSVVTAQRAAEMRTDWSRQGLLDALDGSLRRLRTDRVDGFLLHSPSAAVLRQGDAAAALEQAAASGRARWVGVACDDVESLDAALELGSLRLLELPHDVLAAIEGTPRAAAIVARDIPVIAREVLRFQPGIEAAEAFRRSRALSTVSTILIGSRRADRLRALVDAMGVHAMGVDAMNDRPSAGGDRA